MPPPNTPSEYCSFSPTMDFDENKSHIRKAKHNKRLIRFIIQYMSMHKVSYIDFVDIMVMMNSVVFGQTWSKEGCIVAEEMTEKKKNQII